LASLYGVSANKVIEEATVREVGRINLDEEVRVLTDAELRYRVISEAMARRMNIKNIAMKFGA